MALAHGDDITKDATALGGNGHILVVAAKEPLFVGQLQQDLIKKQVQAVGFAHSEGSKIKESAWKAMFQRWNDRREARGCAMQLHIYLLQQPIPRES